MVTIEVCMGSSCYLRGAQAVVTKLEELISAHGLARSVTLKGSFCLGKCTTGLTIKIGDEILSEVYPEEIERIFSERVIPLAASMDGV